MNPALSAWLSRRLIDRYEGHRQSVLDAFERVRRHDFFTRPLLDQFRNENLALLLTHARDHVPFYREALQKAPSIVPKNAWSIFQTLPKVTRAMIQADRNQFVADNAVDVKEDATGGSTGTPMSFLVDRETQIAREASLMWADAFTNWRYGERIAMLWGSDRDVKGATTRARSWLRWWIENRRWYNAFDMGPEKMMNFHADMKRFRPHILVAYAGSLFEYAKFLEAEESRPSYPLKALISSAEVLSPSMRETIERVFMKSVYDRYGNREVGAIATECMHHQGLHTNEHDMIVEVDSSDPSRTEGNILITYFANMAMPLIRYDTGDLGRWLTQELCACGRTTRRLAPPAGRQSDTIRTSAGRLIHGEFFTHLFYGSAFVRQFQFIQESGGAYSLLVEADPVQGKEAESHWRKQILEAVGKEARLDIRYVEKIPVLPSGKRKFAISQKK